MASRHLITYIYRIRCAQPTKAFSFNRQAHSEKLLLNGRAPFSRNALIVAPQGCALPHPTSARFAIQISVVLKNRGGEFYDSL